MHFHFFLSYFTPVKFFSPKMTTPVRIAVILMLIAVFLYFVPGKQFRSKNRFFPKFSSADAGGCVPRTFSGRDSPLCVCNCTYCDTVEPIGTVGQDDVIIYTTSKSGKRLERTMAKKSKFYRFSSNKNLIKYQKRSKINVF